MILVDANVILDIWDPDPVWYAWSLGQVRKQSLLHDLAIDAIVYSEISVSFLTLSSLDKRLEELGVSFWIFLGLLPFSRARPTSNIAAEAESKPMCSPTS